MSRFTRILAEFPCADVPASVAYYRDTLGFNADYADAAIGVMDRDAARILLITRSAPFVGPASCYIYLDDVDALHRELLAKGVTVLGPPTDHPWGLRDFAMLDVDRNRITFGQALW